MTIDPHKYVTYNRNVFDNWLSGFTDAMDLLESLSREVADAVVIRRQDVFAAPALYAYASTIQTALEIIEVAKLGREAGLDIDTNQLRELAEFFAYQAHIAHEAHGKVPTP